MSIWDKPIDEMIVGATFKSVTVGQAISQSPLFLKRKMGAHSKCTMSRIAANMCT